MLSHFQQSPLEEIVNFKTGKLNSNAAKPDGKYPFFTCSQETYRTDTWSFDGEYVLLAGNNAAGVYPLKYFKGKFDVYQRTYAIRSINETKCLTRYVYYALRLQLELMKSISTGVATKFLTMSLLNRAQIPLPPLPIQRKIASILSAYDDLIENNLRRIKILEEMAQNLYREWFVKFRFPGHEKVRLVDSELGKIPEGWEAVKLGNLVKVRKGQNITKKTIVPGSIPVVAGGIKPAYYHNTANTQHPVVTISASGANAGFVSLYHEYVWASDCSVIDRSTTEHVYFFYLQLKERQHEVTRLQRGAAQPHVYPKDLMEIVAVEAPPHILNSFSAEVYPLLHMVRNLSLKNRILRQTRDLLLPRLISGELDVSELDINVPEEAKA
ncbi:restriction modification system DNA specificity domain protein [Desulfonatronospira thiodismutans ASO3-1]|uniref:Restriction modification system DNA specificity domain protein n=1 Tax=Desulfonatronospira thiodismutans ASO3-1 TaxID=555779 RepID=D6SJT7_9BACT|nr:restriction endonuclease subunit S [Desulfonatronospira thiodismutans]EFI36140.1 restriction modification system DNA specificity domain protein [Desulfonatronospira thiodismutans ASO3-1]